jgi:hypothetical protein
MSALETIRERNAKTETVVDSFGRTIKLRRLNAAQRVRIREWTESSSAEVLGMLTIAASVFEIDGVPITFPRNRAELDSMVAALDDEGVEALVPAYQRLAGMRTDDEKLDAIKN